jgi:sugar phosphate isomerase/epimerase
MIRALSTHLFVNHRLTTVWLERIRTAGIPLVEIFCARQNLDYRNQAQVQELGHWFRDSELEVHSLHSPMYNDDCWGRTGPGSVINICETEKLKRKASVDEVKRALDVADTIPFKYLIQHLGVGGEEYDERKTDAGFSSLEELNVFARQRGVEILLENIPNRLANPDHLLMFLAQTHLDNGFCFDVGHAHIDGGVRPAFEKMKDRIKSTHVHDNDGNTDSHLFPFSGGEGTIDWKETMSLLHSRGDQYPLLLELREVPGMEHQFSVVREVFGKLEALPQD